MQSKRSFFNATLFRKNLSRFWPLWGGFSFVACLFPLYLFLNLLGPYTHGVDVAELEEVLYSLAAYTAPALTLCYAILVGMVVFSYLFSARSVGFHHSLPISRGELYLTTLASGFAMLLIPYCLCGALFCLVTSFFGILPLAGVLKTAAAVIGLSVFYFGTAAFAAMVTGNVFAMPAFYFIGHFLAVILELLVTAFAGNFIFGYNANYDGVLSFLSPTVFFYQHMGVERTYIPNTEPRLYTVEMEGLWAVALYAAVGLALLGLSFLLYRLRRSESAGDVVAFDWLKPLFRYGVAFCAALTGGQLLYEIVWGSTFQRGRYHQMLPMALCMIVAGIIGYFIASMLLAKSLRVFRHGWKGALMVTAMVAILCSCVYLDVFGVAGHIPDKDDVDFVYCSISGEGWTINGDDPLYENITDLHQLIVDSESEIRRRDTGSYSFGPNDTINTATVNARFEYVLKDGSVVYRRYYVPISEADWNRSGTYDNAINRLVNDPALHLSRLSAPSDCFLDTAWMDVYYEKYYQSTEVRRENVLTREESAMLIAAIKRDIANGDFVHTTFIGSTEQQDIASLSLEFRRSNSNVDRNAYHYYSYTNTVTYITPDMPHSMAALRQLGFVTPDTVFSQYGEYAIYGDAAEAAQEILGGIGGDWGTTTIVVTD